MSYLDIRPPFSWRVPSTSRAVPSFLLLLPLLLLLSLLLAVVLFGGSPSSSVTREEVPTLRRTRMLLANDDGDAASNDDDVCAKMDIRVDSSGQSTATVSFLPPEDTSKVLVEYSTGKFPTIEEVDVKAGNRKSHVLTGLDPGKKYTFRITHEFVDCSVDVSTEASRGHDCELERGIDYRGHDQIFGHGGSEAATRRGVGGAKACCDACAAVEPSRPYNDACTHFVYEEDTDTCYFKAPDGDGSLGRETREGYVAGKVKLKRR